MECGIYTGRRDDQALCAIVVLVPVESPIWERCLSRDDKIHDALCYSGFFSAVTTGRTSASNHLKGHHRKKEERKKKIIPNGKLRYFLVGNAVGQAVVQDWCTGCIQICWKEQALVCVCTMSLR